MAVGLWGPGGGPGSEGSCSPGVIGGGAALRHLTLPGGSAGGGAAPRRRLLGMEAGDGAGGRAGRGPSAGDRDHPAWARALAGRPAADERLWAGVRGCHGPASPVEAL